MKIHPLIERELEAAYQKHPHWPKDTLRQAAIVAEEAGELLRAALTNCELEDRTLADYSDVSIWSKEFDANREEIMKEAAQTAAMAIRFLANYE